MSIDLTGWDPEKNKPQTEQKKTILQRSEDPLKLFIKDNIEFFVEDDVRSALSSSQVYDTYKSYCSRYGHKYPSSMPTFDADLKEKYSIDRRRVLNKTKTVFYLTEEGTKLWKQYINDEDPMPKLSREDKLCKFLDYIPEDKQNEYLELITGIDQ